MVTDFEESFEYQVSWEKSAERDRKRLKLDLECKIALADSVKSLAQSHVAQTRPIKDKKTRVRAYRVVLKRHLDIRIYYYLEGRKLHIVRLEAKKGQKIGRKTRKYLTRT